MYQLLPITTIDTQHGCLFKLLSSDRPFSISEFYLTPAPNTVVKGWKFHSQADLILYPFSGSIRFWLSDEHPKNNFLCSSFILADSINACNYEFFSMLLFIRAGTWFAFQGVDSTKLSVLMSLSSHKHDPSESVSYLFSL